MPRSAFRAAIASALLASLAACAAMRSTEEIAVDYNRAFASSRNEVLLLNILRSAAREPMQFSTMGTVSGSVGNGGQLTIPFTNLIAGGANAISPSIQITDAVNPSITVVPLGAREFATGILTPIGTDDLQLFLHGGWDAEFLLPLIIGGIVCPDGRLLLNSGLYERRNRETGEVRHEVADAFRIFFRDSAATLSITSESGSGNPQVLTISDEQTLRLLREGVGADYSIVSVEDQAPGTKRVTIRQTRRTVLGGLRIEELCTALRPRTGEEATMAPASLQSLGASRGGGRVILRSVQTIIYYLGESHRVRMRPGTQDRRGITYFGASGESVQALFRVESGPSPGTHAVATRFHGASYYIPRFELGGPEGLDRTLKTLSFLDQLIALQTSESAIRSTQPILTLPQ